MVVRDVIAEREAQGLGSTCASSEVVRSEAALPDVGSRSTPEPAEQSDPKAGATASDTVPFQASWRHERSEASSLWIALADTIFGSASSRTVEDND